MPRVTSVETRRSILDRNGSVWVRIDQELLRVKMDQNGSICTKMHPFWSGIGQKATDLHPKWIHLGAYRPIFFRKVSSICMHSY